MGSVLYKKSWINVCFWETVHLPPARMNLRKGVRISLISYWLSFYRHAKFKVTVDLQGCLTENCS